MAEWKDLLASSQAMELSQGVSVRRGMWVWVLRASFRERDVFIAELRRAGAIVREELHGSDGPWVLVLVESGANSCRDKWALAAFCESFVNLDRKIMEPAVEKAELAHVLARGSTPVHYALLAYLDECLGRETGARGYLSIAEGRPGRFYTDVKRLLSALREDPHKTTQELLAGVSATLRIPSADQGRMVRQHIETWRFFEATAVIVAIRLGEEDVVFCRLKDGPYVGEWGFPGGYIDIDPLKRKITKYRQARHELAKYLGISNRRHAALSSPWKLEFYYTGLGNVHGVIFDWVVDEQSALGKYLKQFARDHSHTCWIPSVREIRDGRARRGPVSLYSLDIVERLVDRAYRSDSKREIESQELLRQVQGRVGVRKSMEPRGSSKRDDIVAELPKLNPVEPIGLPGEVSHE